MTILERKLQNINDKLKSLLSCLEKINAKNVCDIPRLLAVTVLGANKLPSYVDDNTSYEVTSNDLYNVTSISPHAFQNCSGLTSIVIPDSVTSIGNEAFLGCINLESVVIGNGVSTIRFKAFEDCTNLASVTIGGNLTSIDGSVFFNCSSLASITIPDSVVSIGRDAFKNCTRLESIVIPDSVTSIGEYAFENTAYYNNSSNWENGALYIGNHLILRNDSFSITSYDVRQGTKTIADYAFYYSPHLISVTIPDSVTYIGSHTFYNCTRLESIVIPDSVTYIGDYAFENTAYYKNASNWESGVLYVGNHLINTDSSITSCDVRQGTKTIAGKAFANRPNLISVTIPDSVTSIGERTFEDCTGLTSIVIPDSVTYIGDYAFSWCNSLASVTLPFVGNSLNDASNTQFGYIFGASENTSINSSVPTSLREVIITAPCKIIGDYAFYYCSSLTSITIPDSVTSIGEYAFSWCDNLTSITIPDSVTTISEGTFYYCSSLTNIIIPSSVTSIGDYAFSNCSSLTDIYLKSPTPPSLGSSWNTIGYGTTIHVPIGSGEAYKSATNWSYHSSRIVEDIEI